MILSFLLICTLCALGMFFRNDMFSVTVSFSHYQMHLSVFTFAGLILAAIWFWFLLCLPVKWIRSFFKWRTHSKQQQRQQFATQVLEALVNQDKERYPLLVKQASSFFDSKECVYWLILALLQPSEEVYQKLLTFPATVLGGIYGLLKMAEGMGNTVEMCQLLDSLPEKQKNVLWVKQAYLQLAYMDADWEQALECLEVLKKTMPKSDYIRQRACCLMMAGQIDKAYALDKTQAPIILAKAKENPENAQKILIKAWRQVPCQEIYQAYKKTLTTKTDEQKVKAVLDLIKHDKANRFSVLALADIFLSTGQELKAKEVLQEYLENFPLTHQVALMMAECERATTHQEEQAKEWEKKAMNLHEKSGWICTHCSHPTGKWEPVCPVCHIFNSFIPH